VKSLERPMANQSKGMSFGEHYVIGLRSSTKHNSAAYLRLFRVCGRSHRSVERAGRSAKPAGRLSCSSSEPRSRSR
jgi:hypothetical protein